MKIMAKRKVTKVTTGMVRLSYVHLFEARRFDDNEDSESKFSVCVLIPKNDIETLNCINEAVDEVKNSEKIKLGEILPTLKIPLRDGDVERPDDEAYKNCYFLNAISKTKPDVVDLNVHPIDETEVYSGCYARLTINFYAYNINGNKGIAAGLGNVQKLADGPPLCGPATAANDFDVVEP